MSRKRRKKSSAKPRVLTSCDPGIFEFSENTNLLPRVSRQQLYHYMRRREYGIIAQSMIQVLSHFQNNNYTLLNPEGLRRVNEIVSAFFAVISDPEFIVPEKYAAHFLGRAHLFANLVAISDYTTTDSVLQSILLQKDNLVKLMFLYTVKNETVLDSTRFFDLQPGLSSLWYLTYPLPTIGCVLPHYQANMRRHFSNLDKRYYPADHRVSLPYFYCTYFAGQEGKDRLVKEQINASCRRRLEGISVRIKNEPKRDSIAIVTSKWWPNTAVYKSCFPFLDRFRSRYRMTLIHTGQKDPSDLAKDYFDDIHVVRFQKGPDKQLELTTSQIVRNDYQLMYFADIGMTDESVWLSNLRFAPIQVTGYGHPVSTFGGQIDYFVVGEETEKVENLAENYSEKPIVLPGLGCVPIWPTYKRKDLSKKTDKVVANCVWGPDKYNYTMLRMLQEISRLTSNIQYAIFASRGVHRYNAFLPFEAEMQHLLGEALNLHTRKEYMEYMEEAEYADFTINSWPFGGYNTVVEALYLGKPVVTLEGDRFYNLAASALLHRVGLGHLIAKTAPEFIQLCVRMASDPDFLAEQKAILAAVDLGTALFDTNEPAYFEKMMEYIIDNHESLKGSKKPLFARDLVCL